MAAQSLARSLGKVVVEIRYPPSGVFLDRRGKLLDELQQSLGPGFNAKLTVDTVQFVGDLVTILCDRTRASVSHDRPLTPVLAEHHAQLVWKALNHIDVPREIQRLGTRFFVWWRTPDDETAQQILRCSGLTAVPEPWRELFGDPDTTPSITGTYQRTVPSMRVVLDVARNLLVAGASSLLDEEKIRADFPPHFLQLDVDVFQGGLRAAPAELPGLLRQHWAKVETWLPKLDSLFAEAAERGRLRS